MDNQTYVEALENELAGYELKGKDDRAQQVRDEISRVTGDKPRKGRSSKATAPSEPPALPPAPGQQTAVPNDPATQTA